MSLIVGCVFLLLLHRKGTKIKTQIMIPRSLWVELCSWINALLFRMLQDLCSLHVHQSRFALLPHVAYNIMSLSLDSSPAEVAAFLDAEGFASQLVLDRHISAKMLS